MSTINRKHPAIDLIKVYNGGMQVWDNWLKQCFIKEDIDGLKKAYYGVQAGMTDLAKAGYNQKAHLLPPGINTFEDLDIFFIRLQKSIEKTFRAILRKKYPFPNDNPLNKSFDPKLVTAKRDRDRALEAFFNEARF